MRKSIRILISMSCYLVVMVVAAHQAPAARASSNRSKFVQSLWTEAKARGISRAIFEDAMKGYSPVRNVEIEATKQPEITQSVGDYVGKRVDPRFGEGKAKLREYRDILARIEARYGVPAEVLLAIWGIETNYGGFLGGSNVVHSLATLTERNYRRDYFRKELLTAFEILEQGHVRSNDMRGSWAGTMGQTQFMPSSFQAYTIDFDGDGKKNIWTSTSDALASTANYLRANGWQRGQAWGYGVSLPDGFKFSEALSIGKANITKWCELGIKRAAGRIFPRPSDMAELYLPAGSAGPAFLLIKNLNVIKRYNNANSYALSVGHLADRIAGGGAFVMAWPNERSFSKSERLVLEAHLEQLGYDVGKVDGVIDTRALKAVSVMQSRLGLLADGYANSQFMRHLATIRGPSESGIDNGQ
ncbi:MAG: lytic murein transglycosylase [Allorhizobium sp.]